MLTSHTERNTCLCVGNATYLLENGRLTEVTFKTFKIYLKNSHFKESKFDKIWKNKFMLGFPHLPLVMFFK